MPIHSIHTRKGQQGYQQKRGCYRDKDELPSDATILKLLHFFGDVCAGCKLSHQHSIGLGQRLEIVRRSRNVFDPLHSWEGWPVSEHQKPLMALGGPAHKISANALRIIVQRSGKSHDRHTQFVVRERSKQGAVFDSVSRRHGEVVSAGKVAAHQNACVIGYRVFLGDLERIFPGIEMLFRVRGMQLLVTRRRNYRQAEKHPKESRIDSADQPSPQESDAWKGNQTVSRDKNIGGR